MDGWHGALECAFLGVGLLLEVLVEIVDMLLVDVLVLDVLVVEVLVELEEVLLLEVLVVDELLVRCKLVAALQVLVVLFGVSLCVGTRFLGCSKSC